MKVTIGWTREGWRCLYGITLHSDPLPTYKEAVRYANETGLEIDNAGWRHKMLSMNWHHHAFDGYPGWELERENAPALVKLTHVRGKGEVESAALAMIWDDIASVDFYQRDWTDDGMPIVRQGETYWSGWWFETIAERDRFAKWLGEKQQRKLLSSRGPS